MKYILEVNGVNKNFISPLTFGNVAGFFPPRKTTRALKDISFFLEKKKILCILGPNGAGKTTLLKIISTLILPDKGTISVNGYRLNEDDEKIKLSVGLVLEEERSFYWRLTGRQNLEFFAALYGLDNLNTKNRINGLLNSFKVDFADKRFDAYSTGMKKCFSLIRGLIHNPELILLDEPTKSLDYTSAVNLRNFIKGELVETQGKTIIITTHHLEEALDFADLFIIMNKGKTVGIGTLDELRKKIRNPEASLKELFLAFTQEKHV